MIIRVLNLHLNLLNQRVHVLMKAEIEAFLNDWRQRSYKLVIVGLLVFLSDVALCDIDDHDLVVEVLANLIFRLAKFGV